MADQATVRTVNGPGRTAGPSAGGTDPQAAGAERAEVSRARASMVSNVAGFGENLLNLAELQARIVRAGAAQER